VLVLLVQELPVQVLLVLLLVKLLVKPLVKLLG
jgi:hypothetical protein